MNANRHRYRLPFKCYRCKALGFQYYEFTGQEFTECGYHINCSCEGHPSYEVNGRPQFSTGLTDSKGNEIFEGDIVRGMLDFGPAGFHEVTVPVRWREDDGYAWYYFDKPTIEVIGNAHQNPELLEGK